MGITSINLQTIVALTDLDQVSCLYHPSVGAKLSGIATSQHAATTSQQCLHVTVLLYLNRKTLIIDMSNYVFKMHSNHH